jgi:hypothetical protein
VAQGDALAPRRRAGAAPPTRNSREPDITECNRNVYYEVGYAHAARIPTILLVQKDTTLPFDVSGYRCISYENTISGKRKIIERLQKDIKEILGR